jgi:hypothetical protein
MASTHKILLDQRPGKKVWWIKNADGTTTIQEQWDEEPLLNYVPILSDMPPSSEFRLIALVPGHILSKSIIEGWDQAAWRKWYNDSDYAKFRVKEDTVWRAKRKLKTTETTRLKRLLA